MKRRDVASRLGFEPALVLCLAAACGGEDATTVAAKSGLGMLLPTEPASESNGDDANAAAEPESEHVRTTHADDGVYTSEIDATDMELWVYFNLKTAAEILPDAAEQSETWHLGFQRSTVMLNGGVSGAGAVAALSVSEPFEAVIAPPAAGSYREDAADQDMDGRPDYALSAGDGWYSYDPATHLLSARDSVFVIQTPEGFYKLQFLSYYDAAGTPGVPSFRWAPLGGS